MSQAQKRESFTPGARRLIFFNELLQGNEVAALPVLRAICRTSQGARRRALGEIYSSLLTEALRLRSVDAKNNRPERENAVVLRAADGSTA